MEEKIKIAGGVVVNEYNEVIVVSQKGMTWSLPKGHVEDGEDDLTAAQREVHEESGVENLKYVKELGSYERPSMDDTRDEKKMKVRTFFLFKTKKAELSPLDPDNPEARWISKDKVAELLTHPKDKEFFLKIYKEI